MKQRFELTDFFPDIKTTDTVLYDLTTRFRARRKEMKLSRMALAKEAKVSYASLRRFEEQGDISLNSLLKLAQAMDMLDDFDKLFTTPKITNLKEYLYKRERKPDKK